MSLCFHGRSKYCKNRNVLIVCNGWSLKCLIYSSFRHNAECASSVSNKFRDQRYISLGYRHLPPLRLWDALHVFLTYANVRAMKPCGGTIDPRIRRIGTPPRSV